MFSIGKNEIVSEKPIKLTKIADAPVATPIAMALRAPTKTVCFAVSPKS